MADLNVERFGKKGVDLSKFGGGLKKENLKTEEQKSIFNAIDADKNGVIDEKEMKDFSAKLDKSEDNHVSRREARKFLKENNLKELSKKDVLKFLQQYAINTENVKDTKVVEKDGQKTIHLTYKDGTQEVINPDKSSNITQSDENGNTTTRFLDENIKLLKDSVTNSNGDTVETEYEEDGQTPSTKVSTEKETGNTTVVDYENGKPAKEVVTDNTKNSVSTTNYEDGQPKTKTVEVGETTVSNYTIDEKGNERLESKVENKGIEAKEKRTDYTYNEDGTVTANIKEAGKDTVQQIKDGKVQSEVIKEKDKTTTRTFAEDGSGTEIVEESNGNTSTTNFNAEGHKLSQTKTVNGKTYNVEYDGKGNTKVVLQNGESIDTLAKKFGTTKKAILEANGGKVRGWAGDDLVVPGELSADAKALQGRDSKEVAQAKYKAFAEQQKQMKDAAQADLEARVGMSWTEKKHDTYEKLARGLFANEGNKNPNKYEMQLRIDELKKLNPNIKDGELIGKKVNVTVSKEVRDGFNSRQIGRERTAMAAKAKHEANTGKTLANAMYKGLDDNAGGVSSKEFQNALAKVNKDNVLGVIEQYNKISPDESLIEGIMDETGNSMETRRNAESKIINALIARAKSSGISDERAKQQLDDCVNELNSYWSMGVGYCSTEKLDGLVKNVIGAIHTAESMTKTEKRLAANDNAIDDTIGIMNESLSENKANLQKQLDQDGWCADLYEGLKWCVGSDNLDENVKADLKTFEKSMGELEKARKSGGEAAFKTKFKEIFGVEYDPNLAKGYRKLQSNLANAQALTAQLDGFNKEFANSINGKESYGNMVAKYGSYLQSVSSEVQDGKDVAEKSIALAMQKDGIDFAKATDAQKAKYLQNIIKQTQNGISSKINEYTRGKDLATLENDLKYASTAVFGNKGDIVNRVNSYVNSQQVGGAVVNGAVKAVGAIAIAVVTGGTGLVALSTAALATTALSAATDLTDRASSNVGLQDGEVTNILKNATIDGATVFAGGQLTKAAMALKSSKAFIQAGGRMLAQGAGDVAIGAAAEYGQTGEITLQGVTFQAVFSAAGNLVALKQLAKGTKPATKSNPTPDAPKSTLDVATSDGAKIPGGKLGTEKMNKVKDEVKAELPDATPERGAQIHKEADQLQAQSRDQGREVKHMVEDEFGVVTIGKEHIDISTADAATIERLHKEVSGWSTDTRNKAEILKKLEDRMVELHVSPESPNVTRGSEFVDRINTNANQSATDILAGNPGALPPHDAAILKEHLTNNLNTADEIQGFMDALKKRVGVNEKGNMHVYEVQGVDQAADVMKSAEAKLAKIKARQADVAATNSAADAAINGSRGLNEQEFATIKLFVERTDSAEDLQALVKKFENNKCLRNSQASKKLLKTMQDKVEVLQAKAETPKVVASEQNGVEPQGTVKPKETYVDPHHITLDKAPEPAATTGKTFEDFESVQRKLASEQPAAPTSTNKKTDVGAVTEKAKASSTDAPSNVTANKSPELDAQINNVKNNTNNIDAEIPVEQKGLWNDCKGQINAITDELKNFKGDVHAMLLKCENLFADLKRIANKATASVKNKIEQIIKDLRSMLTPKNLPEADGALTPRLTSQHRMEMGQIGNRIPGVKNLDDLNQLQAWLDNMPESSQRSHLQSQLDAKYSEISAPKVEISQAADYSNSKQGTRLPKNKPVTLTGSETLKLANYDLDLSSAEIQSKLKTMKDGDVITVGRNVQGSNDIKIDGDYTTVSGKHLEIKKVGDKFVVTDMSLNGTAIGKSIAHVSDEIKATFGHQTVGSLADLKPGEVQSVVKGDIKYTIENNNGQIKIASRTKLTPSLNKAIKFDEIRMSNRTPSGKANPGKTMGELLTPQQKKVYSDSMDAFERSKNKKIMHNANNVLTTDNLLHGTDLNALLSDGGILDKGLVPREISGNSAAHFADGSVPDTLTPLCSDVWDIRQNATIKDYFDANNPHWNNNGELNFLPNSNHKASSVIIVFDKKSIDPTIIDNSFGVNNSGRSILFENGNMSTGHNYPTHRAIPIGAPSNSIDRIIVDTRLVSKSEIHNLGQKVKSLGLDIKLYDLNGNLLT